MTKQHPISQDIIINIYADAPVRVSVADSPITEIRRKPHKGYDKNQPSTVEDLESAKPSQAKPIEKSKPKLGVIRL